ncbi:MAG: YkgJ family cysteine cluster protein [Desulfosalsimonadaceae bacterium]
MDVDFTPFFKRYEVLAEKADKAFSQVKDKYPEEVRCKPGCADCCYAMFDLTLIEALYINYYFKSRLSDEKRKALLEKADAADRKAYKIKRAAYKSAREGRNQEKVLEEVGQERIRCPLLNEDNFCDLYAWRPIACRVYGIPLAIGGKGHTCGHSGFEPGKSYPTFNMDVVHDQLLALSAEFVQAIGSKHVKMGDVLVPLSMALLTEYDESYLGIDSSSEEKEENDARGDRND